MISRTITLSLCKMTVVITLLQLSIQLIKKRKIVLCIHFHMPFSPHKTGSDITLLLLPARVRNDNSIHTNFTENTIKNY
jgi:hypothetical protein